MTSDNISSFIGNLGATIKSIVKIILQSRHCRITPAENSSQPVIIMGNGPSLNDTIKSYRTTLETHPLLAVNFAANTPEFTQLRPRYYVLADPHFFRNADNPNVKQLCDNLNNVDWKMTLFVPSKSPAITSNKNIKIEYFNPIGVEGFNWFENWAYKHGYGMPRPRNVLIPSIMIAMALGYRDIYITGADHSWLKTISVNNRNEVVSIQPHFYKEDTREEQRIRTDYLNYPLHQIIYSFYIAFRSYFTIERYARYCNINIYNATPESYIDAFRRRSLPHQQ